jgi:hypothetical protein
MGLQVQRLSVRRERASEQRVTLVPPLAPKVLALRETQEPPAPWSWWVRPGPAAGRADGQAVLYRLGGWAAPRPLGEAHLRQAAAGPALEALRAELPEPAEPVCSQGSLRQAPAAGDARAQQRGDHGSGSLLLRRTRGGGRGRAGGWRGPLSGLGRVAPRTRGFLGLRCARAARRVGGITLCRACAAGRAWTAFLGGAWRASCVLAALPALLRVLPALLTLTSAAG